MSTWSISQDWNAWAEVVEISDTMPVEVTLRAERDKTVTFYPRTDSEYETYELVWGTAGRGMQSLEVKMVLEFNPPFKVGDRVHLTGNFDHSRST